MKSRTESLIKKHAKQMDLYSKMLVIQNRRQKKWKKYNDYESDSSNYKVLRMTFMKNEKKNLL